jgi:hypothetical protein
VEIVAKIMAKSWQNHGVSEKKQNNLLSLLGLKQGVSSSKMMNDGDDKV